MNNLKKFIAGFATVAMALTGFAFVATPANAATAGGVYKDTSGTVWFVTKDMTRRPFTSAGAFMSYGFLSFSQVQEADSSVTALPTGSFIAPQDGRIFCATETKGSDVAGECSLVTAGKKAAFTSASVFTGQGYSFSRAYYGDSSFLEKTSNIDNASAQHRPGTLINNNGTVQLVVNGGLWGTPSMDVFNSWGWSFADVVPANSADVLLSQTGVIVARQAGELSPSIGKTTPTNPGDCSLEGNAGSITVDKSNDYVAEEVGEGEEDQGVVSFEVEADDDSDVAVTSVKVFLQQTDTGSKKIGDYIDEVKVWYGDEEVGSADASSFNKSGTEYTKNISLDCAEVQAGETGDFWVSVTGLDNIDSVDLLNNDFDVVVQSVRFTDADGVTTTLGSADFTNPVTETFSFVDFATANDIELKTSLTPDEDAINDAHSITIDDTNKTDKEDVLAFTMRAAGDSDIWVDEIPLLFTSAGTVGGDESLVVSKAYLYNGSTLLGTETVPNTGIVNFDDLDMWIDMGDSEEFMVKVDLFAQAAPGTDSTLITAVTTANIVAEDEEGDTVAGGNLTGSAASGAHTLTLSASTLTLDDTSHTSNNDGTLGTFVFRVTITAEDEDVNVADTDVATTIIGGAATGTVSVVKNSGTTTGGVNNYVVPDGSSATFTITVTIDPGTGEGGQYFVQLNGVDALTTNDPDRVVGPESLVE